MSLREIVEKAQLELEARSKQRDEIRTTLSKVITLSKRAIMAAQRGEPEKARGHIEEAWKHLRDAQGRASSTPDLIYGGSLNAASQEFVEAKVFLEYLEDGGLPTWVDLGVAPEPYLLGLGDLVGEFRRLLLVRLKEGSLEEAEKALSMMMNLYEELFTLEEPHILSAGLRHKIDVARRLIEMSQSEVLVEIRRRSLEEALKRLEGSLKEFS